MSQLAREQIAGSKWWRVDFHTHTPASIDYVTGGLDAAVWLERWLLAYMAAEIDCVVITDHNTGGVPARGITIDGIKTALERMRQNRPVGFRPLYIFPGVEISVHGGVHCIAIMAPSSSTADVERLLGRCRYQGTAGDSDGCTQESLPAVLKAITESGGIALPAHVDKRKGLFTELDGTTLEQVLRSPAILGVEVTDDAFVFPGAYVNARCSWARVVGSDSHDLTTVGRASTWVKMGEPTIEGLRLALTDGASSLQRHSTTCTPNAHTPNLLISVSISNTRVCGNGNALHVNFNPWLTSVIGGRGSGKSTLIECMRLATSRVNELPDVLRADFSRFTTLHQTRGDTGVVRNDTSIEVVYKKDAAYFLMRWDGVNRETQLMQRSATGTWETTVGNAAERCPVLLLSQKQIYEISRQPTALLAVIDDAMGSVIKDIETDIRQEHATFLAQRSRYRQLRSQLGERMRLKAEKEDVDRQIGLLENAENATVLSAYSVAALQEREIAEMLQSVRQIGEELVATAEGMDLDPLFEENWPAADETSNSAKRIVEGVLARLVEIQRAVAGFGAEVAGLATTARASVDGTAWGAWKEDANTKYEALCADLNARGYENPRRYGALVGRREELAKAIEALDRTDTEADAVEVLANASLARIFTLRKSLTAARVGFIANTLANNDQVRVNVIPFGERGGTEVQLRQILQKTGSLFAADFGEDEGTGGLLGRLFHSYPSQACTVGAFEQRLSEWKAAICAAAEGGELQLVADGRFTAHLQSLPEEALDRLLAWWPGDALEIEYAREGTFVPLQQGSAGQKTAAILAFLLAHGEDPLVLDQPEDDLDTQLIYQLIVQQIRRRKAKRQLVIVTHNPNIVVNGDAELVVVMDHRAGQCVAARQDGLHSAQVRSDICRIMEGGAEAFNSRFRRIHVGSPGA